MDIRFEASVIAWVNTIRHNKMHEESYFGAMTVDEHDNTDLILMPRKLIEIAKFDNLNPYDLIRTVIEANITAKVLTTLKKHELGNIEMFMSYIIVNDNIHIHISKSDGVLYELVCSLNDFNTDTLWLTSGEKKIVQIENYENEGEFKMSLGKSPLYPPHNYWSVYNKLNRNLEKRNNNSKVVNKSVDIVKINEKLSEDGFPANLCLN